MGTLAFTYALLLSTAAPIESARLDDAVVLDTDYINTVRAQANDISCGYSLGVGGEGSVTGLHCNFSTIEFGDSGADLNLRVISRWNHGNFSRGYYDPVWYNGLLTIYRGPVVLGVFRLYGGGGGWVGTRLLKDVDTPCLRAVGICELDKTVSFSGGGFTGIEFFSGIRSYFIEVGAQGAAHASKMDGGLYLHLGSNFFL